jgi:hypothetical protein
VICSSARTASRTIAFSAVNCVRFGRSFLQRKQPMLESHHHHLHLNRMNPPVILHQLRIPPSGLQAGWTVGKQRAPAHPPAALCLSSHAHRRGVDVFGRESFLQHLYGSRWTKSGRLLFNHNGDGAAADPNGRSGNGARILLQQSTEAAPDSSQRLISERPRGNWTTPWRRRRMVWQPEEPDRDPGAPPVEVAGQLGASPLHSSRKTELQSCAGSSYTVPSLRSYALFVVAASASHLLMQACN